MNKAHTTGYAVPKAVIAAPVDLLERVIDSLSSFAGNKPHTEADMTAWEQLNNLLSAAASQVVLPEPDAAINEVMELVKDWAQHDWMATEAGIDALSEESSEKQHQEAKRLDGEAETAYRAIEAKLRALLAGVSVPAAQAVPVKPQPITLTVNQLRQAIEFGTGGFTPDTTDELETQLSICWGSLEDDDGNVTECMRCWLFDYPEEGAIPLDEQPTERDLASLAAPQAQADARDADDAALIEWLSGQYLAADFHWGDPKTPVLVIEIPPTASVCGDFRTDVRAAIAIQAAQQGGE
jgi:hypothetical protein